MRATRNFMQLLRFCLLLAASCVTSCSDADRGVMPPPGQNPGSGSGMEEPYGLTLLVNDGGEPRRLQLLPEDPRRPPRLPSWMLDRLGGEAPERKHLEEGTVGRSSQAVQAADGGYDYGEENSPNPLLLVAGAYVECLSARRSVPVQLIDATRLLESPSRDCDAALRFAEDALCTADKLLEVAEGVQILQWTNVPRTATPAGPWVIPPQHPKNRFIARDLALFVLQIIAVLDVVPFEDPTDQVRRTCSATWARAVKQQGWGNAELTAFADSLDSTLLSDLSPPTPSTVTEHAAARLQLNAFVLRETSRMLAAAVRETVYADMAEGMRKRSAAGDPMLGDLQLWGIPYDFAREQWNWRPEVYYGSLEHASTWTLGRSLGPVGECLPGYEQVAILSSLGPRHFARVLDRPVKTVGQASAARLVEGLGVVFPPDSLTIAKEGQLRQAIRAEALRQAAERSGLPNDGAFASGPGKSVSDFVDSLATPDLRVALDRSLAAYVQLTGTDAPSTSAGGLSAVALPTLGGVAVSGGMPRTQIQESVETRLAELHLAAQCHLPDGDLGEVVGALQDVFSLGQYLRQRLTHLREAAVEANPEMLRAVIQTADGAQIEARQWAGPGRLRLIHHSGTFLLRMDGYELRDLGLSSTSEAAQYVKLIWGEPHHAECAAGTRATGCPSAAELARRTVTGDLQDTGPHDPRVSGFSEPTIQLQFQAQSAQDQFEPVPTHATDASRLWVVRTPGGGSAGRVMSAMGHGDANGRRYQATDSKMRRDLSGGFLAPRLGSELPRVDGPGGKDPGAYCIDGVPSDFFVPLESELISNGDGVENSWRHYLDRAKEAAQRADALASEMLEKGFQKDARREDAGGELAELCGNYSALGAVRFQDGRIDPEVLAGDESLQQCFGEQRLDLLFLTDDPVPDVCRGQHEVSCIKDTFLGCNQAGPKHPLCGKAVITHAGLGLAKAPPREEQVASMAACEDALGAPRRVRQGPFPLSSVQASLSARWATSETLSARLQFSSLIVESDGEWRLSYAGDASYMDTRGGAEATLPWPACILHAGKQCDELGQSFDQIFRSPSENVTKGLLLWRVQGALWTLAAMVGRAPAGLFDVPVPVADFQSQDRPPLWPMPTVFGQGRFVTTQGGAWLDLTQQSSISFVRWVTEGDRRALGIVVANTGGIALPPAAPAWLRNAYADTTHFRLARAMSAETATALRGPWFRERTLIPQGLANLSCPGGFESTVPPSSPASQLFSNSRIPTWDGSKACGFTVHPNGTVDLIDDVFTNDKGSGSTRIAEGVAEPNDEFVDHQNFRFRVRSWAAGPLKGDLPQCQNGFGPDGSSYHGTVLTTEPCVTNHYYQDGDQHGCLIRHNRLRPSGCSADQRVALFINSYPSTPCQAAAQLTQSLGLACVMSVSDGRRMTEPPKIRDQNDLHLLERWVRQTATDAREQIARLWVAEVPKRVVADFNSGRVGTGNPEGVKGKHLLDLRAALEDVAVQWSAISAALDELANDISGTRYELIDIELQSQEDAVETLIRVANAVGRAAGIIADNLRAAGSLGVAGAAAGSGAAGIQLQSVFAEIGHTIALGIIKESRNENRALMAINRLGSRAITAFGRVEQSISGARIAVGRAQQASSSVGDAERKALFAAARGAGLDYVTIDGRRVDIPINTVLRRSYDITRTRYLKNLQQARYLGYMARLAIEQRIGMRLNAVDHSVAGLPAPALWADDICHLDGVDYDQIRARPPEGGTLEGGNSGPFIGFIVKAPLKTVEAAIVEAQSRQWIGDYLQSLEAFISVYGVQYPSHEGEDVAVISVRDDLSGPTGLCERDSRNLLVYSSRLQEGGHAEGGGPAWGWQRPACPAGAEACAVVRPFRGATPPPNSFEVNASWVSEEVAATEEEGTADDGTVPAFLRGASLFQEVALESGNYALSWWDQAVDSSGNPLPTGQGVPYSLEIYNEAGDFVGGGQETPPAVAGWSPRRVLRFVTTNAKHYVVLRASVTEARGSVALAGLQLERVADWVSEPTPYESTERSRRRPTGECPAQSAGWFRERFYRACGEDGRCFFQIREPFAISTSAIQRGATALARKLAVGNFNYRHMDVAVNVVGTGVLDCSRDPRQDCYGSGYLQYSLFHDAGLVPVIDHTGTSRVFDFGRAAINSGKSLATERYITLPIGSSDQGLLQQPQITKPEFRGRPLDGNYRLRIYDSPALVWENVEDVQLVLTYRYWSRVERTAPSR